MIFSANDNASNYPYMNIYPGDPFPLGSDVSPGLLYG